MTPEESAYQTIISKIDLLNEKLQLYKQISDEQIKSTRVQ